MKLVRLFLLLCVVAGCSSSPRRHFNPADFVTVGVLARGNASWYASGWFPRRTASGERYNQNDFTAAHRTLPFGTIVRVVNLRNHRSVLVQITDRGPFARGRVIDLSRAAGLQLDLVNTGTAPVEIQLVRSR